MTKLLVISFIAGVTIIGGGYLIFSLVNKKQPTNVTEIGSGLSYVAVGDSYSIGEGEEESKRWPNQLVKQLDERGKKTYLAANLSRTGYTTQDIQKREIETLRRANPDFVTLLIGVNDFFQGVSKEEFTSSYTQTVESVREAAPKAKILLITIPDYGKTPTGATFGDATAIEVGIQEYNKIIIAEANRRNYPVADIFAVSQSSSKAGEVVADGLHPSGAQYAKWLTLITPETEQLLGRN